MEIDKRRNEFIRRSGRLRALEMLRQAHPIEYWELLIEGQRKAAEKYDWLNAACDSLDKKRLAEQGGQ
jgi:hypothetical protein